MDENQRMILYYYTMGSYLFPKYGFYEKIYKAMFILEIYKLKFD